MPYSTTSYVIINGEVGALGDMKEGFPQACGAGRRPLPAGPLPLIRVVTSWVSKSIPVVFEAWMEGS